MSLLPLINEFVYGPVRSRRLGWSLGVNAFPPGRKVCNFNCAYCQYGWTREGESAIAPDDWPAPASIAEAVRHSLRKLKEAHGSVDRITLAGNGEPTLHPRFGEIVDRLRDVRNQEWTRARIAVLSNGGTLDRVPVLEALRRADEAYLKLDTADPETFKRLNGAPPGLPRLMESLRSLPHVTIQSLFTRDAQGRVDNTTPDAVLRWIGALKAIAPEAVHLYTVDRDPAWPLLEKIPYEELNAIAEQARAAGITAMVY